MAYGHDTFPQGKAYGQMVSVPIQAKQCPKPCFLSTPALDGGEKG